MLCQIDVLVVVGFKYNAHDLYLLTLDLGKQALRAQDKNSKQNQKRNDLFEFWKVGTGKRFDNTDNQAAHNGAR